jgi:hypothetical protein
LARKSQVEFFAARGPGRHASSFQYSDYPHCQTMSRQGERGCCPNFKCSAGFQPALSRQDGGATFKLGWHRNVACTGPGAPRRKARLRGVSWRWKTPHTTYRLPSTALPHMLPTTCRLRIGVKGGARGGKLQIQDSKFKMGEVPMKSGGIPSPLRQTDRRNLQHPRFSRILKAMEVHFTPDVEKKLNDLAAQSGRGPDELLQDALAGYFDELVQTRDMLNSRYDELKSGRVKPLDGEEAFARLKAKTQAQRKHPA